MRAHKIQIELLLNVEHKNKRIRFTNWIRIKFRKKNTMKILFSDDIFDLDGIYNSENNRIWAVNHPAADTKGGIPAKGYGLVRNVLLRYITLSNF